MLQIFKPEAYQSYRLRARLYIVKTSPKPFLEEKADRWLDLVKISLEFTLPLFFLLIVGVWLQLQMVIFCDFFFSSSYTTEIFISFSNAINILFFKKKNGNNFNPPVWLLAGGLRKPSERFSGSLWRSLREEHGCRVCPDSAWMSPLGSRTSSLWSIVYLRRGPSGGQLPGSGPVIPMWSESKSVARSIKQSLLAEGVHLSTVIFSQQFAYLEG